ncbi:MAG TPA: T9SS type A sorting domain-containing protein, partial [Bacteroidia bacterium]|nr:T9SS type A sorting domain-containing protein [Bacteroidia bacterium]
YGTMGWYCNDVYVDPNDVHDSTWYVGVSAGWGWTDASGNTTPNDQGALMKTTNRGKTWTKLLSESNGLSPGSGVFSATINPNNPNQLFVTTTRDGLWMSNNINAATPTLTQVSNFQFGFPMRVLFNPYNNYEMWVTTFGNGVHVGTLSTVSIAEVSKTEELEVYPNPAANQCTVSISGLKENGVLQVRNVLGQEIESIAINPAIINYKINTSTWPNGVYFISVNNHATRKLVINR